MNKLEKEDGSGDKADCTMKSSKLDDISIDDAEDISDDELLKHEETTGLVSN
jgi:hypothetical protein